MLPDYTQWQPRTEARTLRYEQAVRDAEVVAWGGDQTTGQRVAFRVPVTAAPHQFVEVLVRQKGSTAIKSRDLSFAWCADGAAPGEEIAGALTSTLGVQKSSGAYTWLFGFFPLPVTPCSGHLWLRLTVNGAGSSTQALSFGCKSVGSGGNVSVQSRSGGTWGAWSADPTLDACVRVYSGWPALADAGMVSIVAKHEGNPVFRATRPPSWISLKGDYGMEHCVIAQVREADGVSHVLYSSYDTDARYGVINSRQIGTASGDDLSSLVKHDQAPLIARPDTTPETTEHHTPWVYDWTPGAFKMYYREKLASADAEGRVRRLVHATSEATDWAANSANGGWARDATVEYAWPTCKNVFGPHVEDGYLYAVFDLDEAMGEMRTLRCAADPAYPATLTEALPVCVPLPETPGRYFTGTPYRGPDGVWHMTWVTQTALEGDAAGTWQYDMFVSSSMDGLLYSPPTPLILRDADAPGEHCGADGGLFVDRETLLYTGVERYLTATAPHVEVNTNLATIDIAALEYDLDVSLVTPEHYDLDVYLEPGAYRRRFVMLDPLVPTRL